MKGIRRHLLRPLFIVLVVMLSITLTNAWTQRQLRATSQHSRSSTTRNTFLTAPTTATIKTVLYQSSSPEETTKKYGLEAGILESMKQNDNGESAKSLLKRYGIAYLATSIPLALVSFIICYLLVDNGVDVAGLLKQIGIENSNAGEKAGTFALAYAAHKAASPIRFPPTVILTPIVAKLIGKEPTEGGDESGVDK